MAEHTAEFEKDPAGISAEQIRNYLLGGLTGDEQARLEENLFTDPALEEQVRVAECELADDYAFQRLSTAERELFEKKFLVTNDRKRKLAVSTALRNHLAAQAAAKPSAGLVQPGASVSRRVKISNWLSFDRPALGFAFALILLVVFGSVVWLAVRNRRDRQPNIPKQPMIAKQHPVVTRSPESSHVFRPSPGPEASVSPKPTAPVEPESTSVLATIVLVPNAARDGGQMALLTIPHDSPVEPGVVRLQLVLDDDEAGSYSAELLTTAGVSVYSGHDLKTSHTESTGRVVFDVPARLLQSGDYQVKLNSSVSGSVTNSRSYYFRVAQ